MIHFFIKSGDNRWRLEKRFYKKNQIRPRNASNTNKR